MTKPCKICGLETDCEHRELDKILSEGYDRAYNNGLRRAVEIVKERSKVFASPEEAGEREWSGLTIAAIEAEMNVEDEHQARINGISYNGD